MLGNKCRILSLRWGIKNPKDTELSLNNIPGVLENGLFIDLTDKVLVGKVENSIPVVYSPSKVC